MKNTKNNFSNNEQQSKLLIPKIDVVFHSLFRTHKEELTSNFVSSLLQDKVKIIDMDKDRNLFKEYPDEKLGILDLRTELEGGTLCNVEIQLADKGNIIDRILYYWSRVFNQQLKTGSPYQELHKTIAILIIDFELQELHGIEELGLKWKIMLDYHEKRFLTDKLEIIIIEIPKAKRILKNNQNNEIAQWMMFLDNPNSTEVSNIMEENDKIKEAMEELEKISQDESLRRIAELKEKYIRDEISARRYYKEQGLAEGREEGLVIGKQEGLELGKQQGLKIGRAEGIAEGELKQKKEIITNMLKNGIPKEQISSMTNISIEEIEKILK